MFPGCMWGDCIKMVCVCVDNMYKIVCVCVDNTYKIVCVCVDNTYKIGVVEELKAAVLILKYLCDAEQHPASLFVFV